MNPRRQILSALFLGAMTLSLVGCNSDSTSSVIGPDDLSPPQAPSNVHSRYDVPTQRDWLGWNPSASANVASYEVHWSDSPSGIGRRLGTVDATDVDYPLPIVPENTQEYYRLRAVGTNGVPSAFTAPILVQRSGWNAAQPSEDHDPSHTGD